MCRRPGVLTYDWTKNGGQVIGSDFSNCSVASIAQISNQEVVDYDDLPNTRA
jgi:hypothetical protein